MEGLLGGFYIFEVRIDSNTENHNGWTTVYCCLVELVQTVDQCLIGALLQWAVIQYVLAIFKWNSQIWLILLIEWIEYPY